MEDDVACVRKRAVFAFDFVYDDHLVPKPAMSDQVPPARGSQTGVPDLIDDYRKQQDAWSHQARELARLRAEVLAAAEREAAGIVTATRSQIARLLADARRELLGLAAQVQAIPDPSDGSTTGASAAIRDHILEARKDLQGALEDVEPEIERLSSEARGLGPRQQPEPSRPAPAVKSTATHAVESPARHAPAVEWPARQAPAAEWPAGQAPAWKQAARQAPAAERPATDSNEDAAVAESLEKVRFADFDALDAPRLDDHSPGKRKWIAAFFLIGLAGAAGVFWQLRGGSKSTLSTPTADQRPSPPLPATSQQAAADAHRFPVTLLLEADRPSWIRTTIDGRSDGGRVFAAGEKKTLAADREIVLRAGDAGAVFVTVNGAAREALGPRGQTATRRFAVNATPAARSPSVPAPPPAATQSAVTAPLPPSAGPSARAVVPPPAPSAPRTSPEPPIASPRTPQPAESNAGPTLTTAGQRWLDAYYRDDVASVRAMTMPDMKISDERSAQERLPRGLPNVRRALDGVTFQFAGDSAILTARMMEQATVSGEPQQRVAWISQMWIRDEGQWRLMNVHILSDTKLRQPAQKR